MTDNAHNINVLHTGWAENSGVAVPPPITHSYSVSYSDKSKSTFLSALSVTEKHRSGRVVLFLSLLLSLMATACGKEETTQNSKNSDQTSDWTEENATCGITIDTTWEGDTTIYF